MVYFVGYSLRQYSLFPFIIKQINLFFVSCPSLWSQHLGKLRQDDGKFEYQLGNLGRLCLKKKKSAGNVA